jgi:hypothetical protein
MTRYERLRSRIGRRSSIRAQVTLGRFLAVALLGKKEIGAFSATVENHPNSGVSYSLVSRLDATVLAFLP